MNLAFSVLADGYEGSIPLSKYVRRSENLFVVVCGKKWMGKELILDKLVGVASSILVIFTAYPFDRGETQTEENTIKKWVY